VLGGGGVVWGVCFGGGWVWWLVCGLVVGGVVFVVLLVFDVGVVWVGCFVWWVWGVFVDLLQQDCQEGLGCTKE